MPDAPGENDLRVLARRFADAERRVRALVAQAPTGSRRLLVIEAHGILTALRQLDPAGAVTTAYLRAYAAATSARARSDRADPKRVGALAGTLALKLDEAAQTASEGAREAFRRVTMDNVEEISLVAVTAHVDDRGRRWGLGHFAAMTTQTIGRQATSLGTVDAVGDGRVLVEGAGDTDPICAEFIGNTYPASSAPEPPYHPCVRVPARTSCLKTSGRF